MLHIAAMREEAVRLGIRAVAAAADVLDTGAAQALAREQVQIALPASLRVTREGRCRLPVSGQEGRAHIITDFEIPGADGRRQPRLQRRARRQLAAQRIHRGFDDACSKAAPAGMGHAHGRPVAARQHHGQAVGRHHHAHPARPRTDRGIRAPACIRQVQIGHDNPMHRLQPLRLGRKIRRLAQPVAVGIDGRGIISHMRAQVQAVPRRPAHPTRAQRGKRPHAGGRLPLGQQERKIEAHSALAQHGQQAPEIDRQG